MVDRMAVDQNPALAAHLRYCRRLPTLPTVALRLIELANEPETTLTQFADLASQDPALASKLLRVANSSFYGRRRTVSNLTQALNLLGLNATVTLSLSFSLRGSLPAAPDAGFDAARYWRRSLLTALAARSLAIELGETQPDDFFLVGLLQEIGVLVMDSALPKAYATLYGRSQGHEDLMVRESAVFGFNHAEAGAWLLREWQLPETMWASALASHDMARLGPPGADGEIGVLPVCVAVAAGIADAWLDEVTPEGLGAAAQPAEAWLGIEDSRYRELIRTMSQQIPELETLFDTALVDAAQLRDVEESAREILVNRNLHLLQSVVDSESRTRVLERRTTVLEEQARRDAMTGLFNRTYMERIMEHEFERARRENRPLSVAFVDVDRFKTINDTHGHAAGDQVIIGVARRLICQVRQTDIVSRFGGEEFVILLTDTRPSDARTVLERVLAAVRETPFPVPESLTVSLTVSAGIAAHVEGETLFDSAESLVDAADRALYTAKDAGRGCVMLFSETGTAS